MNQVQRSYVLLHISILLWGFTAILGALISLSAGMLVWWRVGATSVLLFLWPAVRKEFFKMSGQLLLKYFWIGILVAIHWVCFFASIKYANASVALITMSMTALFTALIEPFVIKTRLNKVDIGLSILVIPAMILAIYDFEDRMIIGFWLGIAAAWLLAYFTALNRKMISEASPQTITFIEMSSAWIFLSVCAPFLFLLQSDVTFLPAGHDIIYLLVLSIGCTILPFILHLEALKHISAFATNLAINLEPVYGIILAALILQDYRDLGINFYIGAGIIIGIILIYPSIKRKQKPIKLSN